MYDNMEKNLKKKKFRGGKQMKNVKKVGIILLILAIIVSLINVTPITIAGTSEENYNKYVSEEKKVKAMKPGDVIYFDNSILQWEHVYIYIWDNTVNPAHSYKNWGSEDEMTRIGETDFYQFVVPDNDEFNNYSFRMLIFRNGETYSGTSKTAKNRLQTINLGYVETGFAYKVTSEAVGNDENDVYIGGKKLGYWHLYDKQSIRDHINSLQQIQNNKAKYTVESYKNLDELIAQANLDLEKEIVLYAKKKLNESTGKLVDSNAYYICIATPIDEPGETGTEYDEYIEKIREREENNIQTTAKAIDNIVSNLQVFKGNVNIQTDRKWYSYV